jgi:hypothetical protein
MKTVAPAFPNQCERVDRITPRRRRANERLQAPRVDRGASLLETVVAIGVTGLVLGVAADQARTACTVVREARAVTAALTSARNVMDLALATPCAPVQNAVALCGQELRCTITANEAGRRDTANGVIVLVRLVVEVTRVADGLDERRLARLASVAARPETCS